MGHTKKVRRAWGTHTPESRAAWRAEYQKKNKERIAKARRARIKRRTAAGLYYPTKEPAARRAKRAALRGPKPPPLGREVVNFRSMLKRYGLSIEDYEALFAAQGGVCKVCARPERRTVGKGPNPTRVRRLAVDHCHKTERVRALLCTACNTTIGMLSATQLRACADYLDANE